MKRILFLIVFFCMNFAWGQIWVNPLTTGRPMTGSFYLGDKVNSSGDWYFQFEIGQATWDSSQVGIGQNSDGDTGWDWAGATWYSDGSGSNKKVQRNIKDFQFTATGTWFVVGRAKANSSDSYTYADEGGWSDNTSLTASTSLGNCPYFTVSNLGNPTSPAAAVSTTTQINLNWTQWNGRFVLILRNTTGVFTEPTQGQAYNENDVIGDATVVYKGGATSDSDTGLTPNTTYYYKIYSENYSYYSDGVPVNATTHNELFHSKQTGNWSDVSSWEISYDGGSTWGNPSVVPSQQNVVTLKNGHTITVAANASAKSITAESGSGLTVNSGVTLSLTDALTNNGGTITFENNTSLLQTNDVTNTGNITYTRNSTSMKQLDFTYWSSPVAGEFLDAITNTDKLYGYNTSVNYWTHLNLGGTPAASTLAMEMGKGYATRNPNVGPITQVGTFVGVPNNGDITVTNIAGNANSSVFLGNPYPSAIDLQLFHTSTNATNLNGTYYFWTHSTAYNGTIYAGADYASYSVPMETSVLGGSRYVAAGQGFFVDKSTASTISVEFKNSHRVSGNNSGFFRMAQNQTNSSTATVASDKIWFNLISPSQNILKQTLLAYAETASNGYDSIDALTYDGQPALDFYTLIPSYKFVIQARAWEFVDTDVVNIGYRTANAGTFQLVIDHFDPIWNTRSIVLKDNLLNVYHNIKESAYTFTSEVGTFDSRFEIIYQTNALSNPDVSFDKAVIVFAKDKNIHINSGLETIKEVVVYDLQGRIITTKTNINATQIVLENVKAQTQVLLVKVTSTEGKITTKKVVF